MVHFTLDAKSGVPYYKQIITQIEMGIADGRLASGDKLPTVRGLAVELKVNPNTVARAYSQLELLGYVLTQQGTGTFISSKDVDLSQLEKQRILSQLTTDFVTKAASYGFSKQEIIDFLSEQEDSDAVIS